MLGPIFERELATLPRRGKHYVGRVLFALVLFVLLSTAWLLLAGVQSIRNTGDFARFGASVFQILGPVQLVILVCVAALAGTISVAHEKDRKTLLLLLMTDLRDSEVIGGKAGGAFLAAMNLALAGLPIPALLTLMGGVSSEQIWLLAWLTTASIAAATALGVLVAAWREKTFQAIAVTILAIVLWIAACEVLGNETVGVLPPAWAAVLNPLRAVWVLCQPLPPQELPLGWFSIPLLSGVWMAALAAVFLGWATLKLRVWNPSREARPQAAESEESPLAAGSETDAAMGAREVKAWRNRAPRRVWDNPILWREMCTWAYGRKILVVRAAYLVLAALAAAAIYQMHQDADVLRHAAEASGLLPAAARVLAPFGVISLVIINALAVNSITNERDAQALDLLFVTEITPPNFLFGKLAGVLYVCKEMVLAPLLLCLELWWLGGISGENLIFTTLGLIVLDLFVAMLGIHCGITYYRSRTAITTSLGTAFFLFLGVGTCMLIMISFQGSFSEQLVPFLAIIMGGGSGLYYALGYRNPSPAIALAAYALPALTFYSITSFILRNQELTVFAVVVASYGFATLAMAIPALTEFDFALGHGSTADDAEE